MRTPNSTTTPRASVLAAATAILLLLLTVATAAAAPLPTRLLLESHIGLRVDKTTGGNVCTVASHDECVQPPQENFEPIETGLPGAFNSPAGVAVAPNGSVYVADSNSHRVQELDAAGNFVLMFGREVNETTKGDICTAEEVKKGVKCQQGVGGGAPGQFGTYTGSIAVDPVSGDVYVADYIFGEVNQEFAISHRVQRFTSAGVFVSEIGKEVNETTKTNFCAAAEAGVKCKGAALRTPEAAAADAEPGAFDFEETGPPGNLLAVGGPKDRLYVGDHARIQEFEPSGAPAPGVSLAELSQTARAQAVAVDPAGDVFVADAEVPGVREYDPAGVLQPIVIGPTNPNTHVTGLAIDPYGRLGMLVNETKPGQSSREGGFLYTTSGVQVSEFAPPSGSMPPSNALAFAPSDQAYVVSASAFQLESYAPFVFPESRTCAPSEVSGTAARLCGEVNPDGVPATGFFQYGTAAPLGSLTPTVFEGAGEAFAPVSSLVTGLTPNQAYRYRVAVEAEVNSEKLQGHGEEVGFRTPVVPPRIPGVPSAQFVQGQSAVVSATVNPEHTATRYHFQYGPCPTLVGCKVILSTPDETSAVFGLVGASSELSGLATASTYSFRLVADNEFEEGPGKTVGGKAEGAEGTFTTPPAITLTAATGAASAVTSTGAVVSGSVNPDGQPATYSFELGVYAGAATQYGVVFSGPTGASTTSVPESLQLTGLQPGGTYAYRIVIRSGYGEAVGAPAMFTTEGLPSVLGSPPVEGLLAIPAISFPTEAAPPATRSRCKHGYKRGKAGKCVRARRRTGSHGKRRRGTHGKRR